MNKLGFGFLRLPRDRADDPKSIQWALLCQMVDAFLEGGGDYFDTCYTYLDGMSEEALRRSLVERHPRERFRVANKLPGYLAKTKEDCEKLFRIQQERCGTDWFDVYLLHWLNPANYRIAQQLEEFDFLQQLKARGLAKKTGFSYHGDAALLEEILTAHPEIDIVQLQINYLDWNDPAMDAQACYETACRHGKEIVVMEPVKGGMLAALPEEAEALLAAQAPGESPASLAIRFAQELPQVSTVLSGMNTMEQLRDNQWDLPPLTETDRAALNRVCGILTRNIAIPCTGCRYCVTHCPQSIAIPEYFRIYNSYSRRPRDGWKMTPIYENIAKTHGKASQCIACGICQTHCPQAIAIPQWMPKIAEAMEE